ncbi:hypothetical protein PVK06_007770 [Gossypium arboreum]|uniref:Secreted protein n=1 Tax=Gossypium arboreum TaxID=29729 RepID=A0ABR0QIJ1_GOSAR|nr:hypothetical protein PVK06_007770 [Gossypium arboreum]
MIDPRLIEMCYALVILWFFCGSQKLKVFTNTASILAHQEQALLLSILSLFIVPVHQQNNPPAPGTGKDVIRPLSKTKLGCGKNGCAMAMEDQQLQSPCGTPLVSRGTGIQSPLDPNCLFSD